jgi:hypothetical protein
MHAMRLPPELMPWDPTRSAAVPWALPPSANRRQHIPENFRALLVQYILDVLARVAIGQDLVEPPVALLQEKAHALQVVLVLIGGKFDIEDFQSNKSGQSDPLPYQNRTSAVMFYHLVQSTKPKMSRNTHFSVLEAKERVSANQELY